MAEDTTGAFNGMFRENLDFRTTAFGSTSEYAGTKRTSSNVKP
jgi:hypothetical protein